MITMVSEIRYETVAEELDLVDPRWEVLKDDNDKLDEHGRQFRISSSMGTVRRFEIRSTVRRHLIKC